MTCPKCKKPKTKKDFYYRKGSNWKVYDHCKDCHSEVRKKRYYEKEKPFNIFNLI